MTEAQRNFTTTEDITVQDITMSEWKHIVMEWLAEYAALQPHEVRSFAAEHEHNHEIATAIFSLLYSNNEAEPDSTFHGSNRVEIEEQHEQVKTNSLSIIVAIIILS